MEIKSFDTILTTICDDFDALLSPVKMVRANTNIFYLLFKAIAKGWEIMNNVCVVLNNKFNPLYCTDEDLESVGKLVGTKRRGGSVSGLRISVYNSGITAFALPAGTYVYKLDDDVSFSFTLETDALIPAEDSVYFTALSDKIGAYRVTQQTGIEVTADGINIPPVIQFSCADNLPLLGHPEETVAEFRQRVNSDTDRQDAISELREKILALPYVYDCSLVFNQEESEMSVPPFIIPAYYLLIVISTAKYTDELAEIIAGSAIYPTVNVVGTSHEVRFANPVFAQGYYSVYLNDFIKKNFEIELDAVVDSSFNSQSLVESKIESALQNAFNTNVHRDMITVEDVYNEINKLNLAGVVIRGVSFIVGLSSMSYVSFSRTELPNLTNVGGV
jgi:hypothetical protein